MKKILSILVSVLFTLSSFGQGSLNLEHQSGTIQKVGDEFVMKMKPRFEKRELRSMSKASQYKYRGL